MGWVELVARQEGRFQRFYAIKRLHAHLREDRDFHEMFLDEARVAGLIDHPNVVGVLDVGTDQSGSFLVMPYVRGVSLARLTALARSSAQGSSEPPIPIQVCVRIALDVARGLHAAHELRDSQGALLCVVHRDLSPQNILIGFDGTARVTDFGIAKAIGQSTRTSTGVVKGKYAYMSPEQLRFQALDRRSDLFALGTVLFEMLAGSRLYGGVSADGPRRILEEPPPDIGEIRPAVPPKLVELILELLAKEPADRPPDAGAVATRLELVLADLVQDEAPITVAEYLERVGTRDRERLDAVLRGVGGSDRSGASERATPEIGNAVVAAPTRSVRRRTPGRLLIGTLLVVMTGTVLGGLAAWTSARAGPASEDAVGTDVPPARVESAANTPALVPAPATTLSVPHVAAASSTDQAPGTPPAATPQPDREPAKVRSLRRSDARRGAAGAARGNDRSTPAATTPATTPSRVGWDGQERAP